MRLENGAAFPPLEASRVGGGTMRVPGDLGGAWGVLLFYRGHW